MTNTSSLRTARNWPATQTVRAFSVHIWLCISLPPLNAELLPSYSILAAFRKQNWPRICLPAEVLTNNAWCPAPKHVYHGTFPVFGQAVPKIASMPFKTSKPISWLGNHHSLDRYISIDKYWSQYSSRWFLFNQLVEGQKIECSSRKQVSRPPSVRMELSKHIVHV